MKKKFLGIGVLLGLLIFVLSTFQPVHADLEWSMKKQLDLGATPLDIATSADGTMIFILVPGEILIYSIPEDKEIKRIPVEETFDSLTHSAKDNSLILSDSSGMKLMIIELENVFDISISDLPQKGAENAPVTISVFNDYQ